MSEDTMDESTNIVNQQNEISKLVELSDTKIEKQKELNFSDPEIGPEVKKQDGENITAIAALLLQNSIADKLILKESKEFSYKNNSDKNENTIGTCQKILSEAPTNGSPLSQDEVKETMIRSPLPDSELENSNSCQEKILSNSKDSSMLSTTDTQDEIECIDNVDHLEDPAEIAALSNLAKQQLLAPCSDSDDSLASLLGSDFDSQTGSEYSEPSHRSIDSPIKDIAKGIEYAHQASKGSVDSPVGGIDKSSANDEASQGSVDHPEGEINKGSENDQASQGSDDNPVGDIDKGNEYDQASQDSVDSPVGDIDKGSEYDQASQGSGDSPVGDVDKGSEYDDASQSSGQETHLDNPVIDQPTENGNANPKYIEIEIETEYSKKKDDKSCRKNDENKTDKNKKNVNSEKPELRRSSRTVKLRKYSYDEQNVDADSEIEECDSEKPLKRNSRPIMINDTKSLVEIAARQAARSTTSDRREPQLVLIGAKPKQVAKVPNSKITSSSIHSSLYQSIVARGTTVTPVPSKASGTTASQAVQTSPSSAQALLPSLTDDMFVVEAPSFIVPYVYEKPSVKPFKEFVTKLGKDIEEQRAKAEKEELETKKNEKIQRQKERQERLDQGKEVSDSEEGARQSEGEDKTSKTAKKNKRRHGQGEDDSSWEGSDSTDSEDNIMTDGLVLINKDEALKHIKKTEGAAPSQSNSYFDSSLGKFFTTIGMGLVEEYVQRDLLKTQQRMLQRAKKAGHSTEQRKLVKSIILLSKNYEISKQNNKSFTGVQIKCEHCTFKTDSEIVLAQHMETPHMKNNMYKCNFCDFEIRSPHDILLHMKAKHNIRGRLERAPAYHQCVNCPFEDNGKGKLARHVIACAKKFKPQHNLSPPVDWEPPAKIPKITKGRQTMLGAQIPPLGPYGRPQPSITPFARMPMSTMQPSTSSLNYRPRTRVPGPIIPTRPIVAGGSIIHGCSIQQQQQNAAAQAAMLARRNHPSISITPLPPRPPPPPPPVVPPPQETATTTFVICEICDGYIKDLEQLRNHMQWIHRVKIHPKMIYNRPPLNCQKCQFRFFTDMGLERHLLGSHALVTSSMQEAANRNKDAGRCPVCGKVFQWQLLAHMAKDHEMTLKPAHLSYKCTVCSATFEMYKLFENHVYSAHSVVAKRVIDNVPVSERSHNIPKGLKLNNEITITAQPARSSRTK